MYVKRIYVVDVGALPEVWERSLMLMNGGDVVCNLSCIQDSGSAVHE